MLGRYSIPLRTMFHKVMQDLVSFWYRVRSLISNFFFMFIYTFMTEKNIILNKISVPASELFLKYS